jgi:copper resistance protein D
MKEFLIAARALQYASTIMLIGVCAFLCLVAGPAFRLVPGASAAAAPLRCKFAWLSWTSLVLALVSGAAWLAADSSTMSGEPLTDVLSQGIWITVLTQTRFGQVWLLRSALAAMLVCCLLAQHRQRNWASGVAAWAAFAVSAPVLAALALAGHGAATPGAPGELHLAADILHLLAAGFWLGTLAPLALLLAEARHIGGAGWTAVARAATRRFSAMAVASVAVLFAGGLVNTWFLAGSVPALLGTEYGHLLLAKIALFVAMVLIAAVNLFRLTPRLAKRSGIAFAATLGQLRRNASIEAGIGLGVLCIVAVLGILPPGLHVEPGWPLPFRIDTSELSGQAEITLLVLALLFGFFLVACVILTAAGHYRRAARPLVGLVLCLTAVWLPLRAAIEPAYPTTFYMPAEPDEARSVTRGVPLYTKNCALCHGTNGKGDGPAAAALPIRPADLTAPQILAYPAGDLFWWISHGRANGVMPGFAQIMSPDQRWDIINFIRARAAGLLSRRIGPSVTTGAAYPVPDFTFERDGRQLTLTGLLGHGPVLLILFSPPTPAALLARLSAARRQLAAADLAVVAVDLGTEVLRPAAAASAPRFVVAVAPDVATALRLFTPGASPVPSALLLDRAGDVRARWTLGAPSGLPDPAMLAAAATRAARFPAAARRTMPATNMGGSSPASDPP